MRSVFPHERAGLRLSVGAEKTRVYIDRDELTRDNHPQLLAWLTQYASPEHRGSVAQWSASVNDATADEVRDLVRWIQSAPEKRGSVPPCGLARAWGFMP
jgi:hypothetical protein